MVKLVSRASVKQPILIIVEDVHWAEPITLSYLAALTKAVAGCAAVLIITSRIEGDPLDQTWRNSTEGSPFITIDLGPLRKQESIDLIKQFIDSGDPLAQGCLERAAGNPLFLEQLLRNAQEGSVEGLPDSIQSLVLARIDRLTPTDKRALQAASVIGQRFEVDTLRHLLEEPTYDCRELVEHNLVRSAGAAYLFAHALIQEGVYGSLLKRQRRNLHGRAAQWFTDSDSVLHAEHLDRAGDEKAPAAYLAAAREQAQQYRYERALELVNRALEIVPDADSFAHKFFQGELLRNLGSVPESIVAYRQASELALGEADRCRAWIGVAEGLRITEEHDELLETLDRAETIAKAHNISPELARISQLKGGVHFMRGEIDDSLQANTRALKYARDASSPELEAQALSGLGDAEYARGRMISAYGYYHECVELGREHGFGRIVAANLVMRGDTRFFKNEAEAAAKDFRMAVELAAKTRQPRAEMLALAEAGFYMW
ncbi:MAG: adenylate/guanylate cyclase domain-containing protein, partial [Acidiferrobacterales bacterium]